ncbi:MAG: YhbY family RNA-binding protein [bacterium]|nr:YhbY family RNA-binding protein [bacterium]
MRDLTSAERKRLRSLAHHLEPVVFIGKSGVTDAVVESANQALGARELIKVRFVDLKDQKKALAAELVERTGSALAGIIGHIAILYLEREDVSKRKIDLDAS